MLPPSMTVEAGVATAVACDTVGVAPVGPDVAGAGVAVLPQAAAARAAIASSEASFFLMSSPSNPGISSRRGAR